MDFIPWELIILILFFLLPSISRLFQSKREEEEVDSPDVYVPEERPQRDPYREHRPQRERPTARQPAGAAEPESLEDALQQIREALGQPAPKPEPRPEPTPTAEKMHPQVDTSRPPAVEHTRRSPEYTQARSQQDRVAAPEPVSRYSGREVQPQAVRATRQAKAKPVDISKPLEVEVITAVPEEHKWLVDMLRDPREARKAIKMHEVLDPPPSVRRMGFSRRR